MGVSRKHRSFVPVVGSPLLWWFPNGGVGVRPRLGDGGDGAAWWSTPSGSEALVVFPESPGSDGGEQENPESFHQVVLRLGSAE